MMPTGLNFLLSRFREKRLRDHPEPCRGDTAAQRVEDCAESGMREPHLTRRLKSQQHHTIPRWLLENFTDRDGMLHVARSSPRAFFKSKPRNAFRRRDYYAAREIGRSLELEGLTAAENLFLPLVGSVLCAARKGIDDDDLSGVKSIADDVRGCGLFLLHLAYRSPQWLGENFFSGMRAIQSALAEVGEDRSLGIREESMRLVQTGEFVLVFSQVDTPKFVLGDCGPFVSRDTELGVDNEKQKRNDPTWIPASQRYWMALSAEVALGVAMRDGHARGCGERTARYRAVSGLGGSFQRSLRKA